MAWMQSHHAEATVWPLVHHGMNALDGCAVDIGQEQGFDVRLEAAFNRCFSFPVKWGLVQMGVGIDDVHCAKLLRM